MKPWAKVALIVSWCITFWAVAVCVSVSCAIKRPNFVNIHQYQTTEGNPNQPSNSLLHEEASAWVTVVIPAIAGFIGAIIGGIITWISIEKVRKRKSVYDVAEIFGSEARLWADKPFQINNSFIAWHGVSIERLSPHIAYVERNHHKISNKIWPWWKIYNCGDTDKKPDNYSYSGDNKKKDDFVNALYAIADILRDS